MKIRRTGTSFTTIAALLFCLGSYNANADYSGGQITDSASYEGEIVIDTPILSAQQGAIWIKDAGKTVSLTGNISINSGTDADKSSSVRTWSHGISMQGATTGSNISLITGSATDIIQIDVYGYTASGVRTGGTANGKVLLDATSSAEPYGIIVNLHNTTDEANNTQEAAGFYIAGQTLEAKGNIQITTQQARGYGYWVDQTGVMEITGDTVINTSGNGSYGIRGGTPGTPTGTGTGSITHWGNLSITTTGSYSPSSNIPETSTPHSYYGADGIRMQANTSLTVTGKTTIDVSGEGAGGIIALENSRIIMGEVDITTKGDTKAAFRTSALAYGLYSSGTSRLATQKTTIRTEGENAHGIVSADSGLINVNGDLDLQTVNGHGVYANGADSAIYLSGANNKIRVGNSSNKAIYANEGLIKGTGKYDLAAGTGIYANSGTVDLTMENGTQFNGFTAFDTESSTGSIILALKGDSMWTLSQDSELTKIDVEANSGIAFNIFDQDDYRSITCSTAIMEAGSIVDIYLNGYDPVLEDIFYLVNSETYQIADTGITFNLYGELSEGVALDTSYFHNDGSIRFKGIPEPAGATLALIGMAALFFRRQKHAA